MKISPISNFNYGQVAAQKNAKKHDPNFKAQLYVSQDVELLMRVQAQDASKGNKERYQQLMYGFGKTMENLMERVKPLPGALTVVLNNHLEKFLSEPIATRGQYYGPQLSLIPGLPIGIKELPCYEFTYRPNDTNLVDKLYEEGKRLIAQTYGN